ncbi:hypothetical protein Bhyg_01912 [Pseudolycoriella hygida]|uniref:Uncharacterized protein n=1 Tax=Pseudolycoriella hygida TaxID=35572 RepID=A0A9Q0NCA7_9DIPT|nr:hypothetical protein Bhyg_01912 [Pseudolycoriella hygida]
MAEQYDGNGDFNYADGSSDFKRKTANSEKSDDDLEDHPIAEKVSEYLRELLSEKVSIDHKYPHAERLLEQVYEIVVYEIKVYEIGVYQIKVYEIEVYEIGVYEIKVYKIQKRTLL